MLTHYYAVFQKFTSEAEDFLGASLFSFLNPFSCQVKKFIGFGITSTCFQTKGKRLLWPPLDPQEGV